MDLDSLRLIAIVAQQGSFAGAARMVGMDPSSVSRSVATTEAALGLRVFQRSTRTLRMTASGAFADTCNVPLLSDFQAKYPDITVELLPTDANLDIAANPIDLAIRLTPTLKGDLISTRLRTTRYLVCATPAYLAENAPSESPKALTDHNCLRFALPE